MPPESVELTDAVMGLREACAGLGAQLAPESAAVVKPLIARVLTYYSARIEGIDTTPVEIEAAAAGELSPDPVRRDRQAEAMAQVRALVELRRLASPPFTTSALEHAHRALFARVPESARMCTLPDGSLAPMEPGALRQHGVRVGMHVAPDAAELRTGIAEWARQYARETRAGASVVAAIAAHHRAVWLHPFPDGNGRAARLCLELALEQFMPSAAGLWSASRALGLRRTQYFAALAGANTLARGAAGERGHLSPGGLAAWCSWALAAFRREVATMSDYFERMPVRIAHAATDVGFAWATPVLVNVWRLGELRRSDAAALLRLGDRQARRKVGELITAKWLTSERHNTPLRFCFPPDPGAIGRLLPGLYPGDGGSLVEG